MTQDFIISEASVAKRLRRGKSIRKVTSNGTIAAAVMVVAAVLAVVVANTPAYELVHHFFETPLTLGVGAWALTLTLTLEQFVNDFLMAVFFLLVGIELKYEMVVGELRHPRQAALPMLAAVGGVMGPCIIYLLLNLGEGGSPHGWAVPMATDIAFALGIMSLLGERVAPATKIFFSTLAIADDILAIVVIALFYGQAPSAPWLVGSAACVCVLALLARLRVYSVKPYVAVGLVLWMCMFNSGVHATLAGVILGLFLPARSDIRLGSLNAWLDARVGRLADAYDNESHILGQHDFTAAAAEVERVMHHVTPPLQRVERAISVPVNFVILPLFAFANARLRLVGADPAAILASPVAHGVFLGAFLGKPIGIIGMTFALVKIGFAKLPRGVDWVQVAGVGLMGGLGFTMSILISGLAFASEAEVLAAKCAILACSIASALVGSAFIVLATRRRKGRQFP